MAPLQDYEITFRCPLIKGDASILKAYHVAGGQG